MPNIIFTDYASWKGHEPNEIITCINGNSFIMKEVERRNGVNYYKINCRDMSENREFNIYASEDEERRDEVFEKLITFLHVVTI